MSPSTTTAFKHLIFFTMKQTTKAPSSSSYWPNFLFSFVIKFHERVMCTLFLYVFPRFESSSSWNLISDYPKSTEAVKATNKFITVKYEGCVSISHSFHELWAVSEAVDLSSFCHMLLPGLPCPWTLWVILPALWWLLLHIYIMIFLYLWTATRHPERRLWKVEIYRMLVFSVRFRKKIYDTYVERYVRGS